MNKQNKIIKMELSNKHSIPIKPMEYDKWSKYIGKINKLVDMYGFILIQKNNVERIYKDYKNKFKLITSFRFVGKYYKERECCVKFYDHNIDVIDITHYSSKKIYKRLKEVLKSYEKEKLLNKVSLCNNETNVQTKYNNLYDSNDYGCYVDIEYKLDEDF